MFYRSTEIKNRYVYFLIYLYIFFSVFLLKKLKQQIFLLDVGFWGCRSVRLSAFSCAFPFPFHLHAYRDIIKQILRFFSINYVYSQLFPAAIIGSTAKFLWGNQRCVPVMYFFILSGLQISWRCSWLTEKWSVEC